MSDDTSITEAVALEARFAKLERGQDRIEAKVDEQTRMLVGSLGEPGIVQIVNSINAKLTAGSYTMAFIKWAVVIAGSVSMVLGAIWGMIHGSSIK